MTERLDYESFTFSMLDNPRLSKEFIQREAERVSEGERESEIYGRWSDGVGSFFPRDLLARATAPITLPDPAELPFGGDILSVDWAAAGRDHIATVQVYRVVVAHLNPDRPAQPVFVPVVKIFPSTALMRDALDEILSWPAQHRYIATEVNGVGAMPSQELRRRMSGRDFKKTWVPTHTTSGTKTAGYTLIRHLLERDQLILPPDPTLQRQLAAIHFEQGARGFLKLEADEAVHDDVADALCALATLPQQKKGRVRCHLQLLADAAKAPADAELPDAYQDDDIVTTGGGLRVYRNPVLQGVQNRNVHLPAANHQPQRVKVGSLNYTPRSVTI